MNKSSQIRHFAATAVIGAFTLGFTLTGRAAATDTAQAVVKYGDLSVTTSLGANTLYRRLYSAARSVCSSIDEASLAGKHQKDVCIDKAMSDAVAKVGQPALTAIYGAKNARPATTVRVANR
jgi:UrcA family protein